MHLRERAEIQTMLREMKFRLTYQPDAFVEPIHAEISLDPKFIEALQPLPKDWDFPGMDHHQWRELLERRHAIISAAARDLINHMGEFMKDRDPERGYALNERKCHRCGEQHENYREAARCIERKATRCDTGQSLPPADTTQKR